MTIYKGKNVDEAIEKGLAALNLKKNEVHINIIEKGQAGIFGFFEKEAEVEITPLSPMELKNKKINSIFNRCCCNIYDSYISYNWSILR